MTRSQTAKRLASGTLLYLALTVAVIAALPVLALVVYGIRFMVPVAIVACVLAFMFSRSFRGWLAVEPDNSPNYHGLAIPDASLWAHPAHSWAQVGPSGEASVGADALVLAALGSVATIEAPAKDSQVKQGQRLFTLTRQGRRLDIKSPVSGVVADINANAVARPALLRETPYGAGWVVRLRQVDLRTERSALRRGGNMRQWFKGEVDRLTRILNRAVPTMADGGVLSEDLASHIDDSTWNEVAHTLFAQD